MKVPVANVWFDNMGMSDAVAKIVELALQSDRPRYVCTGNLDHLARLDRDPEFLDVYRRADVVLADGAPVLWLSRLSSRSAPIRERVAGSDLFWEFARKSEELGLRLFFLGGRAGSTDRAAEAVIARYPRAVVCGAYCPPEDAFDTAEEQSRIAQKVRDAAPNILLVGLGAPKQELWISRNLENLRVPVSIGIGGAFEMAAGGVRRAPIWMRRFGLEWAYRFGQEPVRLFRRYFLTDAPFLAKAAIREITGGYRATRQLGFERAVE